MVISIIVVSRKLSMLTITLSCTILSFIYFITNFGRALKSSSLKGERRFGKKKNNFAAKSWIRSLTCQKSKN